MQDFPDIQEHLEKLLASPGFRGAERMRRFLSFAVTEMLAGRGDRLKEYAIGVHVFDRPESFDPATDPIVRVEARRLREKLDRYYQSAGHSDDLVIQIPTGRYVPHVVRRRDAVPAIPESSSPITVRPFTALNRSAELISEGLLYEMVHVLMHGYGVAVSTRSRTAVEPGTGLLVTGCIQSAEYVHVTAQLLDGHSGQCRWSDKFCRPMSDNTHEVLAAEIAQSLAGQAIQLSGCLSPTTSAGSNLTTQPRPSRISAMAVPA